MQRIIHLLIFQSTEPQALDRISPWVERRFPVSIEDVMERLENQQHRRAMKSHLPIDGLPIFDDVKYVHVARDGRDMCMSYHNHVTGFNAEALAALDRTGREDATINRPYPRAQPDPAAFFRAWLTEGVIPGQTDGRPTISYFELERSFWEERTRSNLFFVHYNDLKINLNREMRRLADFLDISIPENIWPELELAATFEIMKQQGDRLSPGASSTFVDGAQRLYFKASNDRWKGVLTEDDLKLYHDKIGTLPADCARWLTGGGSVAELGRIESSTL